MQTCWEKVKKRVKRAASDCISVILEIARLSAVVVQWTTNLQRQESLIRPCSWKRTCPLSLSCIYRSCVPFWDKYFYGSIHRLTKNCRYTMAFCNSNNISALIQKQCPQCRWHYWYFLIVNWFIIAYYSVAAWTQLMLILWKVKNNNVL